MMRWLVLSCVLLVGCTNRVVVPRDTLLVCPPEPPGIECHEWPKMAGNTLRAALVASKRGELVHAQCAAAVRAWEGAWRACAEE